MPPFTSTVTTKETDTDNSGKKSTKEIAATTSPAPTNQFEHATWRVEAGGQATILSLQPAGFSALYLAIYRVSNDDDSSVVTVQTDVGPIPLAPGTSLDVSTQTITIKGQSASARGSYQNLCCSAQALKTAEPKSAPISGGGSSFDTVTFPGNGGGGDSGGGPGPGGGDPGGGSGSGGSAGSDPGGGSDTGGGTAF